MPVAAPTDFEIHLFHEGNLFKSYGIFGAHVKENNGEKGMHFCVWAPHAKNVRVVGDFNNWSGENHEMQKVSQGGIWSLFISGIQTFQLYKYEIVCQNGNTLLKSDPYAFYSEIRPKTASITYDLSGYIWNDRKWNQKKKLKPIYQKPVIIYEIHFGSWKKKEDGSLYSYREMADLLIPYVVEYGFTHIELMPIIEHPYDRSWGYQGTGYFSATSRFGTPHDFMYFIDQCHQNDIGVIMDWVPGHFCKDAHGLSMFDGEPVYEYQNEHDRENWVWGTANFDLGKTEVHSFLISSAMFWIEYFHIDGFRVDAVANLLYWPNQGEAAENPFAVNFIKKLNEQVFKLDPNFLMIAEDSTNWPKVTHPVYEGGLGFNYKWNMGWMNDVLKYIEADISERGNLHNLITFSLLYAYSENYILPFSHDEVVHGKRSLLNKMPGDYWQKFAQYRLLLGYMFTHPGKKLIFMGGEFAQFDEWKDLEQLDWFLDEYEMHHKAAIFSRDLTRLYRKQKILFETDHQQKGFEWIDANNREQSIFSFIRFSMRPNEAIIVVCNFTPAVYHGYNIGVPFKTKYTEIMNSDDERYGGSHQINPKKLPAKEGQVHNKPFYISMTIPPYGISVLRAVKKRGAKKK